MQTFLSTTLIVLLFTSAAHAQGYTRINSVTIGGHVVSPGTVIHGDGSIGSFDSHTRVTGGNGRYTCEGDCGNYHEGPFDPHEEELLLQQILNPTQPRPVATRVNPRGYVVQRGDTLGAIATHLGCSLDAVMAANPHFEGRENAIEPGELVYACSKTDVSVNRMGLSHSQHREFDVNNLIAINRERLKNRERLSAIGDAAWSARSNERRRYSAWGHKLDGGCNGLMNLINEVSPLGFDCDHSFWSGGGLSTRSALPLNDEKNR